MPKQKIKQKPLQLNYTEASEKHLAVHNDWRTRIRLVAGSVASGKTLLASYEILSHLLENPDYIGKTALVVSQNVGNAKKQIWEQCMLKILTNFDKKGNNIGFVEGRDYTVNLKDPMQVKFKNGSTIHFASYEQEDALAGWSVSLLMVDELARLKKPEIFDLLASRVRGESQYGFIICTMNPESFGNWCYQKWFKYINAGEILPGVSATTLNIYDNRKNLGEQWIKEFEESYAKDPQGFRRYALGEWLNRDGLVINQFDQERHVYKTTSFNPVDKTCPVMAGLDFGGAFGKGDQTACLWVAKKQHLDSTNHYYIFRQHFENDLTITKRAEKLLNPFSYGNARKPEKFISDHASEVFALYKQEGLQIQKAQKGKGSIEAGIDLLNSLFYQDRLHVYEGCKDVIRELLTWSYKQTGNNAPEDKNNHTIDALRYVMTEFEGKGGLTFFTPDYVLPPPTNKIDPKAIFIGFDEYGQPEYIPPCF